MNRRVLTVDIHRCPESLVVRCTSDDIPGLNLETNTMEEMEAEISLIVPELAQLNLNLPEDEAENIVILIRNNRVTGP